MRLGWCAPLAKAAMVRDMGYDYLEVPLAAFGLENEAELTAAKKAVTASPLPLTVFNWFYPQDFRVAGPMVDAARIKSYLKRAAELMQHAGAEAAVLGSAWSRNVPDGFSRDLAEQQLTESYHWVADAFAQSGVTVGIEAQNRKEANIITRLEEAVAFAKRVNRPEIRIVADFYHMDEEKDPLEELKTFAAWITHIQLADTGRLNPGTGAYDYSSFFQHLNEGGYSRTLSVECMVEIPPEGMKGSLAFLRGFQLR